MGVVGGLIAMQPDLSAVITIGLLGTLMFFLAGGSLKHFLFMMANRHPGRCDRYEIGIIPNRS